MAGGPPATGRTAQIGCHAAASSALGRWLESEDGLHRARQAGAGRLQHPRGSVGPREGDPPAGDARQHPQPAGPSRPHLRRPPHPRGSGCPDGLPLHGPAPGARGPRGLPLPRRGRGDPPDRQRLRRRRHRRDRVLPRLRHPPDREGALRRCARLRDRHRHAVGRRRHRPGPAPDRGGAGDRPHRLRQGARDGARDPRAPHRRGGDRGRPAAALAGPDHGHRLHGPALSLLRADARRPERRHPRVERGLGGRRPQPAPASRARGPRSTGSSRRPRTGPRPASTSGTPPS